MGQNVLRYNIFRSYTRPFNDIGESYKRATEKIVKYTGIFSKMRHCLPEACRKMVCHAFIHSRLSYASEIYVNTTRKYTQP